MLQNQPTSKKIDWKIINGLRGLAALYVVVHHSRHALFGDADTYAALVTPKESWGWWEWLHILIMQHTELGVEFVTLFFVLSGFSIAHSLANKPAPDGFYTRRLTRLYPTYLAGIAWAILIYTLMRYAVPAVYYLGAEVGAPLQEDFLGLVQMTNMIKVLLYIPGNDYLIMQYWSLPLEVVFYMLAPWAIRKFKGYAVITIALYLLGWAIYGMAYQDIRGSYLPLQFTFDYGIYFLAGIFLYKYKDRLTAMLKLNKLTLFAVLIVMFEVLVVLKSYVWHSHENKLSGLFMVLFSYVILLGFLKHDVRIKWLEKIGNYSYTLYVTHMASLHLVCIVAFNMGLGFYHINVLYVWYLGVAVSLLFAYIIYWLAEKPSATFLENLRKRHTQDSGYTISKPVTH